MRRECTYHKLIGLLVASLLLCNLSGCMMFPKENEKKTASYNKPDEPVQYTLISPKRMDMDKAVDIPCTYRQKKDVPLSFKLSNRVVDKVNVSVGDVVKKGDLLATLQMDDLEEDIKSIQKEIKLMEKSIELLKMEASYDKQAVELDYKFKNLTKVQMNQSIRMIEAKLDTEVEAKEDEIYIQKLELKEKKKTVENGKIYAPTDGVMRFIKYGIIGSISDKNEEPMAMVDILECSFETYVSEDSAYLKEGQTYTVDCDGVTYEGTIEPREKSNQSLIYLQLKKPPTDLKVGQSGIIHLLVDSKKNVLVVPTPKIHSGEGYNFVYVLNKDNVRTMQKVEIGIKTKDYTEIVSGLKDDDLIINE